MINIPIVNTIKKTIARYQYISFDMFDTLVKRDCCKPVEVFAFIENEVNQKLHCKTNFYKARILAERIARKNSQSEEVTLDEIYHYLDVGISDKLLQDVEELEKKYEFALCQMNPVMKPIYDYCVSSGKKIIITTDIYLPESLIRKILDKVGIHFEALFVSSSYGLSKAKGSLFKKVLDKFSIQPSELLHIGDNMHSDYRVPQKLGISAIHISKDTKMNLFINRIVYKNNQDYANLCAFISNHVGTYLQNNTFLNKKSKFFAQAGYEAQGPTLYGYVTWLQQQFKKDGIEKVFFLARDGQLMQKAYKKLSDTLPNTYMYASRKALIIPSLWMTPSISEIVEAIFWGRRGTITSFLKKIGLMPNEFERYYKKAGFSINALYEYQSLWMNPAFQDIFEAHIKPKMISHSREMYDLLLRYLEQIHFNGKVAVVDIGWFGHMQSALEKVVKKAGLTAEIHGYYLGLRPESPLLNQMLAKGYLFDNTHNRNISEMEKQFNSIVEMLFTADHGTTKGYKAENNIITPVLGKWEYSEKAYQADYVSIRACQDGAIAFVDDMLAEEDYFPPVIDPAADFTNWVQLGNYPATKVAEYFGNLHFLDDSVNFLAKPQKRYSYLCHPKSLLLDFRDAQWRVGFLTRAFGDKIPYAIGYELLRLLYFKLKK